MIEFSESDGDGVYHVIELTQTCIEFAEAKLNMDEQTIAAAPPETDEAEAAASVEATVDPVQLLIQTLTSGGKGYKGEITGFLPEPTEDNSYLWDADKQQFAGQFLDFSGNEEETYDFTITLQPDGSMIRSYRKVQPEDEMDVAVDEADVEADADMADEADSVEMSEGMMHMIDPMQPPAVQTVTVPMAEYETLQAKSRLYSELLEEMAERDRMQRKQQLADALAPLYDTGMLSNLLSPHEVASALLSMSDSACCDESYELEFSEGETHTSPLQTVVAVFKQLGTKAKILADTEIEFGEMQVDETLEPEVPGAKQPAGFVANGAQAALDKKARKYCADQGWDPKDNRLYMKAIKAVSA
jgi:hypothetical protein